MELHLIRNGRQEGPYPVETVERMLAEGSLRLSDFVWHEEMPDWQPLSELVEDSENTLPEAPDDSTLQVLMPSAPVLPRTLEPATARQKAFLSYMGFTFAPDLSQEQAAPMVNDAMEHPRDPARLGRWSEDCLRLHPDIFAEELRSRKEDRPSRYLALVEREGSECFQGVSKAHCQVLVNHLDIRFPNWDAREKDALWHYFFPALAEKFPQLVHKSWKGKLHFPTGPQVAEEVRHAARHIPLRDEPRLALRALGLALLLGALGVVGGYLFLHPELVQWWRLALTSFPSTAAAPTPPPPLPGETPGAAHSLPPPASRPEAAPTPVTATTATPAAPSATLSPSAPSAPQAVPSLIPAPPAGASPSATTPSRTTLTVLKPLDVQLAYGKVRLNPGITLPVIRQSGTTIVVKYSNATVAIPISATDWR